MQNWKYNYIILGSDWDLYKYSYSDIREYPNVQYLPGPSIQSHSFLDTLRRLHFNVKLNSIINVPFKKVWNRLYFSDSFAEHKPLCFIVFNNWIAMEADILDYISNTYSDAKIVWMCQDLISTEKYRYSKRPFDVPRILSRVDLALSFDYGDCEKYGMIHYPLVFSSYHGMVEEMQSSDVYFLGKAKDRLNEIISVYDICTNHNLICDFYVVGVNNSNRVLRTGIHYIDSMPYSENLQHILHTKCLLEVMQKNGRGYTQRVCEAVCLDKLLLTNNKDILNAPFYNSEYISVFDDSNIDTVFLNNLQKVSVDYRFRDEMSPKKLLKFIDSSFSK